MEQNNYLVFQNIVHFYYQRLINGIQTVCFLPAVVDNTPSFSAWIWILYYFVPFVYFRSCYYQQRFALVYGSMEDPALTLTLPASALLRDSLRFLLAPVFGSQSKLGVGGGNFSPPSRQFREHGSLCPVIVSDVIC